MSLKFVIAALGLAVSAACAQSVPDLPQYFVGGGLSYNRYASPPIAAGFVSFAARIGTTPAYSITTVDLTSSSSTVREEGAVVLAKQGKLALFALGGVGLSLGSGSTSPAFSGGGGLLYQLGSRLQFVASLRLANCTAACAVNTNGAAVQAVAAFGLGITFK